MRPALGRKHNAREKSEQPGGIFGDVSDFARDDQRGIDLDRNLL